VGCGDRKKGFRGLGAHHLLPMSMMVMLELECCLASSSHVVRWLKVSRLRGTGKGSRGLNRLHRKQGNRACGGDLPGDVIDEECPGSTPVVGSGDGPERLLSCGVPDLQLDLLAVDGDHPRPKLNSNGEVVHRLEPLVSELQQQT